MLVHTGVPSATCSRSVGYAASLFRGFTVSAVLRAMGKGRSTKLQSSM